MTAGGNGEDGRPPSGSDSSLPRGTPSKVVVRTPSGLGGGGESGGSMAMGAADTAMAMHASADVAETAASTDADPDPTPAAAPADEDMLIGTTLLGRYQVTKKIGQGGMGAVYEATHSLIGKRVAVKVLLDKYARKEQVVARLEQEARLASAIGHEHIIDITDFGTTADGRTFVVMEFLEGESLAECLSREPQLPETRILQIAGQIAGALAAAHAKGIVHRDVKPEHVFLLRRKDKDFVKVVDFGISKSLRATGDGPESPRLTQTGMVLGTPLYMSPEQARGDEELDARIDIYALGVIMYEASTGKVPFGGTNYLSVISQVLNDDPTPPRVIRPDLSREFEAIVQRALEKDRDRRYQTVEEMIADINALLDDPMRSTQRPRIVAPRRRPRGGTKALVWIAAVAVLIAAVAVTVTFMMSSDPASQPAGAADAGATAKAVLVDDAAAAPAPDARPAAKILEIYIDSVPRGAQVYNAKGRNEGKTPVAVPIAEDAGPSVYEVVLDGYKPGSVTLDPSKDARFDRKDRAKKVTLERLRGGGGGGGGGTTRPKVDAGTPRVDPPKGPCPDGLQRNPHTGKCPGES